MDIITLQEYKSYQGLKNPDNDPKITFLVSAVSNLIKAYTGLHFGDGVTPITDTYSFDYDTNSIYLNTYPVASVQSVTILGSTNIYPYDSTVHWPYTVGTDYYLSDGILNKISGYWPQSPATIQVTYMGGFASDEIPQDLQLAAIQLIEYYVQEGYKTTRQISGTSVVNQTTKDPVLPPHIRAILDSYKTS